MPRSLIGSLLRRFSATSVTEEQAAAGKAARERALFDAQLLPEALTSIASDNRLGGLKVGIVGAGFAGLSAAWYLRTLGADVTVFEALDRVGGRVQTDREFIPVKFIEAGAELIGDNHPLWLRLAREFQLDLVELNSEQDYATQGLRTRVVLNGQDLTDEQKEELHNGLLPHLDVIGAEAEGIDPARPWDAPGANDLDDKSVADKLDQLDMKPLERAAIEFTLGNDACAPLDSQSYLGLLALISAGSTDEDGWHGYWEASETRRCAQGNQELADRIVTWLNGGRPTVHTGTKVTEMGIATEPGFAGVTVSTADGKNHKFAYVILAVPAPQWSTIGIQPPLPPGEYEIDHGPAVKYLAAVEEPAFTGTTLAPLGKFDDLGSIWESTERQQPAGPPHGLTVFSGGEYVLPESDPDRLADAYAAALAEKFPDMALARGQLVDWRATGYSVPTVGQVTTVGKRLSEPYAGRLYFAGEQTSMGFYGYMEGALQSGARAANAVVRDALGAAVPALTTSGAYLPLGHRDGTASVQRLQCQELAAQLTRDAAPFAGDRVDSRYSLPASAPAELRSVCAVWSGTANIEGGMVTVEMKLSLRLRLGSLLGEETPIPVRATYGPVQAQDAKSIDVAGGALLGVLAGNDFTIRFQDQGGFHLHPLAVFDTFERLGLWADTGGVRCPLLPEAADVPPMAVAGPEPAANGAPHLVLSGGSRGWTVHHPPDPLPPAYLSFLSSDTVGVTLGNPPVGARRLKVTDSTGVADWSYRTAGANPIEVDLQARYDFVPDTALPPVHPPYGLGRPDPSVPAGQPLRKGSRTPGAALTYSLVVIPPEGGSELRTTICQDIKDVIRQEYRFHNRPFTDNSSALTVPARARIDQARTPYFVTHFRVEEFAKSNYFPVETRDGRLVSVDPKHSYLVRGPEILQVAEYLHSRYTVHLEQQRADDADMIPATVLPLLKPTSTWRNPERNENVGGVRTSNHQWGQALDVRPSQDTTGALHARLLGCLFAAARDFLQELVDRNGQPAFGDVEILLEEERSGTTVQLWSYRAGSDGSITDKVGPGFRDTWGSPASIPVACEHATHVHVAWKSKREDTPLELPPVLPDPPPPPPAPEFRNLILIGAEHESVPHEEQLPLNHVAESLRAYLSDVDPETPTEVHVVSDPVEWLARLGAFTSPGYLIRYLFTFNQAWEAGLVMKNYPHGTDYKTGIHDPVVMDRLGEVYDSNSFDETSEAIPETGTDDRLNFKTHLVLVANLIRLPEQARMRLRRTFAHAQGVYIVGCLSAFEEGTPHPSFCTELATVIGKPVRGANYYSKVYAPDGDGEWETQTLTRQDPTPAAQPVVLVPGGYGLDWKKFVRKFHQLPPDLGEFIPSSNLLELYDTLLTPCFPEEP